MENNRSDFIIGCHDSQAKSYDERVINDSKNEKNFIRENYFRVHEEVLRMAKLKKGENLLDIGIGTGLLEEKITVTVNISGIDVSEKMMEKAKEKNLGVELKKGSFTNIPYKENMFDVIVSCFAFHHLSDEEKVESIFEMKRVLKDNGRIVIGDFMCLNAMEAKNLKEKFKHENRNDMILEMEEENFTNIEKFKSELEKNNFKVKFKQISVISWVLTAELTKLLI